MLKAKLSRINIVLLCILILALILRIIYLGSKSLWLDEAVNIWMAEKNIFSQSNDLPPLYFAVLHFWLYLGKSETVVRFLSVIFGVFSVFTIYKIGIILYGEKEALISAFLLSISQTSIFYSQDARYYSLVIPLSLLSVYFFLRMEEKPTSSNRILFSVSTALAFYNHYFTIILLIVFIIFKIWKYKKYKQNVNEIKSFLLILGILLLLIAPILPIFISQTLGKAGTSYANFKYQTHLSLDFMKEIFTYLIVNEFYEKESILPYIILGLFLYGLFSSLERFEKSAIFLMMWLLLPVAFAAVMTPFISNLHVRYIVFILPALLLISSRGIATVPDLVKKTEVKSIKLNSFLVILVLAIIVLSSYPILKSYYSSENYDWRGAAEFFEKNAENGSNIVLVPGYNIIPFNYYYKIKHETNVLEYSSFDEFVNLSFQNNTYLVLTSDVFALKPDEVARLRFWIETNMKSEAGVSSISIYKNAAPKTAPHAPSQNR